MHDNEDYVFFIPACGLGERVKVRGEKPFIDMATHRAPNGDMLIALDKVMTQAPEGMDIEIALRRTMGCPALERCAMVHFMEPTRGQADTIRLWLQRTRLKEWVIISNCDNWIDPEDIKAGMKMLRDYRHIQGIVFTFTPVRDIDYRFSYVDCDANGVIRKIVEKQVISKHAVAGIYILNMFHLKQAIRDGDLYLSETLARMHKLIAFKAEKYMGWNDMEQLEELERGELQHK